MSDQEDEAEFTENEVNDLNILLQSMSDTHCKEFGHFRLLVSLSGDEDTRVTSKYGMGKQVLLLLRQINNVINQNHTSDEVEMLELNFSYVFDKRRWPDHEEIANNYDSDGEDYNNWDYIDALQVNEYKCVIAQSFGRCHSAKHSLLHIDCGTTTQSRGMYGLGCLLRSIPQVNLVSVNLANNEITCGDAIIACNAFKGLSNLTELDMSHNNIRKEGAIAIFTSLLGHPSCNIQKLNLSHNRSIRTSSYYERKKNDPGQTLIDVLRHTNRSLVELNVTKTGIRASYSMMDIFVCPLLLDSNNDILKYVEDRNHYLKELQIDDAATNNDERNLFIRLNLQHVIRFNKDGPQQALAAKLYTHFETDKNKEFLFKMDAKDVLKYLEFVGINGNLFTLMKLVRNFQAQGSLF